MLAGIVSANSLHYLKRVCRHLNHPAHKCDWAELSLQLVSLDCPLISSHLHIAFFFFFHSQVKLLWVCFSDFQIHTWHACLSWSLFSGVNHWVVPANHLHQSASLKRQRAESHNRWMKQEPRVLTECRLLSERKIYQRTTFFIITVLSFPLENVWHIFKAP